MEAVEMQIYICKVAGASEKDIKRILSRTKWHKEVWLYANEVNVPVWCEVPEWIEHNESLFTYKIMTCIFSLLL